MPRREQAYCIVLLALASLIVWLGFHFEAPTLNVVGGAIGAFVFLHVIRDGRDLD